MKITEGKPSDIKIKKYAFSNDNNFGPSVPKPLPQRPFCMGVVGQAGSGKSCIVMSLLCRRKKCYNKQFDRVEVFSPSLSSMRGGNPFESLPEEQVHTDICGDDIREIVESLDGTEDKCCIYIDDFVNTIARDSELQSELCKLIMNRRHIGGGCSIILTTQIYNKMPLCIRKTQTHLFMMNSKQKRELESLFDEHCSTRKEDFFKIVKHAIRKKHDGLFMDMDGPADKMFWRVSDNGFTPLALNDPEELVEQATEEGAA